MGFGELINLLDKFTIKSVAQFYGQELRHYPIEKLKKKFQSKHFLTEKLKSDSQVFLQAQSFIINGYYMKLYLTHDIIHLKVSALFNKIEDHKIQRRVVT